MTRLLLRIHDYLIRHKVMAWVGLVFLVTVGVILSLQLRYLEDVTDFLPQDETNRRFTSVYDELGNQGEITIIFHATNNALTSEERELALMDAVDWFGEKWDSVSKVSKLEIPVRLGGEDYRVFEAMEYIREHVALFLTPEDYTRIDSLLVHPGYVDSCMNNVRKMMAFPLGEVTTTAIANDPLNLFSPALQRLSQLNASDGYVLKDGYIFDKDGRAYAFLKSPFSASDTKGNSRIGELLESVITSKDTHSPEGIEITAIGAPLIAVTNAQQIKKDSLVAIIVASILILGILLYAVRRKRNLFWLGFTIVFGWLMALAVIAVFKTEISIIVIGIASVLVGIAVNYPLHFLERLAEEGDKRATLKEMIDPLVTGNVTTVSAFACLVFVKAEAMRDLGLFGALMLVGTIFFVMVFLPLVSKGGQVKTLKCEKKEHYRIHFIDKNVFRHHSSALRRIFFLLVTIATVALGWLGTKTTFDADLHNINYMTKQQQSDLELLSQSIEGESGTELVYIVSEGSTLEDALESHEKLTSNYCLHNNQITIGPLGLLPSEERQRNSLGMWNMFIKSHATLGLEVQKAARKSGFAEKAFAPFESILKREYEIIPVEKMTCLKEVCKNYVINGEKEVHVVSFSRMEKEQAERMKREINSIGTDVFAFDINDVGSTLIMALNNDFNYILFVCSFVVFFFLWLSLGRLELALLTFIPLTVGWLWILGLMDLMDVKFNIVNIILATFIFGQGDDYTIFITEGLMKEYASGQSRLKGYTRSVVLSALLMFIGIGVLIFAKHPAMRSLGEVAVIGMATVLLMACYLPPLIFRWLTQKNGIPRQVPLTFRRLANTTWMMLIFVLFAFVIITPYTFLYRLLGKESQKKRMRFHQMICHFSRIALRHLPGVKYNLKNYSEENFDRPAIIIANHQSHLDLLCILSLTPKLVVLTNDWVWRNPIYGAIIRYAEFYPASNGFDNNLPRLKSLLERGYSVMIFPEGTRSYDGKVGRFHKGAFEMAKRCGVDIVPIYLHGTHDVMPKGDNVLREGRIDVMIGKRIGHEELTEDARTTASKIRITFEEEYKKYSAEIEDEKYFRPLVRHQYLYKGRDIARHRPGETALLRALAHPKQEFDYYFEEEEDWLVAEHCAAKPTNLHFHKKERSDEL